MTEADEVAESFKADLSNIHSIDDARSFLRHRMTPDEVGFQLFDNIAESLYQLAQVHPGGWQLGELVP